MDVAINAVLTGKAQRFTEEGEESAIAKTPSDRPLKIGFLGVEGDEQADMSVHGGPDKAIHHYPLDHYAFWRAEFGALPLLDAPGAFGENISTNGLVESEACLGDRYRLGSALVEIAQGRQPCWKQGHRFGIAKVPAMMVRTGRSGWYYRVIEEGVVAAGEGLAIVDRPLPRWPVARVFALLIGGKGKAEPKALGELAQLDVLAANWRARAVQLIK